MMPSDLFLVFQVKFVSETPISEFEEKRTVPSMNKNVNSLSKQDQSCSIGCVKKI